MTRIEEIDNIHYIFSDSIYDKDIDLTEQEIKIIHNYIKLSNKLWHIFNCAKCNRSNYCFGCNESKRQEYSKLKKYILD